MNQIKSKQDNEKRLMIKLSIVILTVMEKRCYIEEKANVVLAL